MTKPHGPYPDTLPHVALSLRAHNREALHRTDDDWLAAQWADPTSRVLVLNGTRVRVVEGRVEWLTPAQAPPGERILLGHRDQVTRFAVVAADPDQLPGAPEEWVGLRGLFGLLAVDDEMAATLAPWLFHAIGLAEWRWSMRHCPRCGGALVSRACGHELRCTACGKPQYPRSDPAIITTITYGEPGSAEEQLLLGRHANWPEGQWSTLAGFCEPGETLEDTVRREVFEETGVHVGEVAYFGSQPWPLPASLMVGFTGRATSREIHVDGAEIAEARWFTREELAQSLVRGTARVPQSVSISSSLITAWYGGPLPQEGALTW